MTKPESLADRAAQLIMPRLGSNMPPSVRAEDDRERVEALLEQVPVGGLVLFRGHARDTPAALDHLQEVSKYPLLVGSDLERGAGQQLAGATVFPHSMAFGAIDEGADLVRRAARITANEARRAGVNWIFAPVADVHSNPKNPIISTRAFASTAERCAELAQAFIVGCREGRALSTAKHFPGHGDTATDSHDSVPAVDRSRQQLDDLELLPFRAAIRAGVDSVMTAHVKYRALDRAGLPATYSSRILRDLLRTELGFNGVVVSDSLLMAGAGAEVSARVPELVAGGIDVLLDVSHPEIAMDALVAAVQAGSLSEDLLNAAFERVWAMKARLFDDNADTWGQRLPQAEDGRKLASQIATRAMAIQGDPRDVLSASRTVPVVIIRPHLDYPDPTRADTQQILAAADSRFQVTLLGPGSTPEFRLDLLRQVEAAGRAILVLVVKPAAWHKFGLLPEQATFAAEAIKRGRVVLCSLGSPDADHALPSAAARVVSFSDVEPSAQALSALLVEAMAA